MSRRTDYPCVEVRRGFGQMLGRLRGIRCGRPVHVNRPGDVTQRLRVLAGATALVLSTHAAYANEAMAKANGCTGCQDVSKKKTAPAFWVVAAEWKKGDVDTAVGGRPRPGLRS